METYPLMQMVLVILNDLVALVEPKHQPSHLLGPEEKIEHEIVLTGPINFNRVEKLITNTGFKRAETVGLSGQPCLTPLLH